MKKILNIKLYIPLILSIFLSISYMSFAIANSIQYFCTGEVNQFFITFDTSKKTITVGNSKPKKYWTKSNYNFWHSAKEFTVYEYTFKNSYNKLSGKLSVKAHHLITSENKWYDYECLISK